MKKFSGFNIFLLSATLQTCDSFVSPLSKKSAPKLEARCDVSKRYIKSNVLFMSDGNQDETYIDPSALMDMDIIIYKKRVDPSKYELGAIQEDGTLAPLSAWTTESAFGDSIEFLVDEEDRWMEELNPIEEKVDIVCLVGEDLISYGSRQVGGGKGPGNPHGEESELLYYIDRKCVDEYSMDIVVKPDLEILW